MPELFVAKPFMKALHDRRREPHLTDRTLECVARLLEQPDAPGLNLETLYPTSGVEVCSARIDQQYRLIVAWPDPDRLVLLYFDNHDEAYDWATRSRDRMRGIVDSAKAWEGIPPKQPPPSLPSMHDDDVVPVGDAETLRRMLAGGLTNYLAYLDETQRYPVEFNFEDRRGLMFVKGGAGTGKTAIAIHRMLHLARTPELDRREIQYLCFNRVLAESVFQAVSQLAPRDARRHLHVATFHQWCGAYLKRRGRTVDVHSRYEGWLRAEISRAMRAPSSALGGLTARDITSEIMSLIKPWGIESEREYLDVERRDRPFRLTREQRSAIWGLYESTRPERTGVYDYADIPTHTLGVIEEDPDFEPYRYVIIDEAQDCTPAMVELARRIVGGDERRLMALADPVQSIYSNGFHISRRAFSPRGAQSITLRVPYRSTQRVHRFAAAFGTEPGGEVPETLALHDPPRVGSLPVVHVGRNEQDLEAALVGEVQGLIGGDGEIDPGGIAILTFTNQASDDLQSALERAGIAARVIRQNHVVLDDAAVKIVTAYSAKGLEFPAVFVFNPSSGMTGGRPLRPLMFVSATRSSDRLTFLVSAQEAREVMEGVPLDTYVRRGPMAHVLD